LIISNSLEACSADDIDNEDVSGFDHRGRTFAIYRSPNDRYYATDGLCTLEKIHLAEGLVMDHTIEFPKHNGRSDYTTAAVQMQTASGRIAVIIDSRRTTYGYDQRMDVHSSKGMLSAANVHNTTVQLHNGHGTQAEHCAKLLPRTLFPSLYQRT
jgi:3-phenylpropionate/trans-cinnamate dioxygenase ferredoxin component